VDSQDWKRVAIAGALILVAIVVARLVDRALMRRIELTPEQLTRYRVLRRSITAGIVLIGVLSALLIIPEVRAAAGGILASSAILGLVLGLAARTTIANFVAGILLAFTQPIRLGDEVEVAGAQGTVEEIALTYTTIRTAGGARYFVPNEKLALETIRNATAGTEEHLALVTVPVPLASDLDRVLSLVEEEARTASHVEEKRAIATISQFEPAGTAIVSVEAWAPRGQVGAVEAEIRQSVHRRLRAEGVF
jgi:small-conductance mechanosensitive channel